MKTIISNKGFPVPIEMRPIWRISLIALCISVVGERKGYLDLTKINILVWMLVRKQRWTEYEDFLFDRSDKVPTVSVDTANYTAVEIAITKDFMYLDKGRLYLKKLGQDLCDLIFTNEVMIEEHAFLILIGKKLTEKKINMIIGKK